MKPQHDKANIPERAETEAALRRAGYIGWREITVDPAMTSLRLRAWAVQHSGGFIVGEMQIYLDEILKNGLDAARRRAEVPRHVHEDSEPLKKPLSKRMRLALLHLLIHGNLPVGNYRLQEKHTHVPSNTFNALQERGLAGCFFRGSGQWSHKIAFITDAGREQLVVKQYGMPG